jgi:hypothetical protein
VGGVVALGGASLARGDAAAAAPPLRVLRDLTPGGAVPGRNLSTTNEPCAARAGWTIVVTGNWFAAVSTDDGNSFRFLDPFSFFPPAGLGFCCDQSVVYDPSRDLFIWLLLYQSDGGGNTLRIATARSADVAADRWAYHDFTPPDLGLAQRRTLDFPQMALSAHALFVTLNVLDARLRRLRRTAIVRLPLDDLAGDARPPVAVFTAGNGRAFAPVQGASETMYWVAAKRHNPRLRLYRWPDGGIPERFARVRVRRGGRRLARCPGPDGRDWCGASDDRVLAAWVARGVLGFLWNAPAGHGHRRPYVRGVRLDEASGRLLDRPVLASPSYAVQYPSLGVNVDGDVAGVVAFGGGALFPGIALIAWNEATQGFDFQEAVEGSAGPVQNRWGDFFCARPDHPGGRSWVMAAHVVEGDAVEPHVLRVALDSPP